VQMLQQIPPRRAGVGIIINLNPAQEYEIARTVVGGAAHAIGQVMAGDVIISIDQINVLDLEIGKVMDLLTSGPEGSIVRLELRKLVMDNHITLHVDLKRTRIALEGAKTEAIKDMAFGEAALHSNGRQACHVTETF
jgi:C-terminal processing protease CtpA/Prc